MLGIKKLKRILKRKGGPEVKIKNPQKYLHSVARRRAQQQQA